MCRPVQRNLAGFDGGLSAGCSERRYDAGTPTLSGPACFGCCRRPVPALARGERKRLTTVSCSNTRLAEFIASRRIGSAHFWFPGRGGLWPHSLRPQSKAGATQALFAESLFQGRGLAAGVTLPISVAGKEPRAARNSAGRSVSRDIETALPTSVRPVLFIGGSWLCAAALLRRRMVKGRLYIISGSAGTRGSEYQGRKL